MGGGRKDVLIGFLTEKNKMGRPRTRWKDEIAQTAGEEWSHLVADRYQWRDMMEAHVQLWMDMGLQVASYT